MMDKENLVTKPFKEKYYYNIDFYKFIASVLIIFLHTQALSSTNHYVAWYTTEILTRIAVPFFFMTSGFLLANKFDNQKNSMRNNIKRLGFLYVYWCLIYLPIKLLVWYKDGLSINQISIKLIQTFAFSGMDTHLWYLPALLISFMLLFFLIRYLNIRNILTISLVLYLFGSLFTSYNNLMTQVEVLKSFDEIYKSFFLQYRNGIFFGFYFVTLGVYIKTTLDNDTHIRWLKSNIVLIAVIILYIFELVFITFNNTYDNTYSDMRIMLLILVPIIFYRLLLIKKIDVVKNDVSFNFRNISFLMYANHILVYMVMKQIIIRTPFDILYYSSFMFFIIVLVMSILLAKAIIVSSKYKYLAWLKKLY